MPNANVGIFPGENEKENCIFERGCKDHKNVIFFSHKHSVAITRRKDTGLAFVANKGKSYRISICG